MLVILDYVQLASSVISLLKFPVQLRLQKNEGIKNKLFSLATLALIIWRTLIIGSRIMIFVLFASMFQSLLYVIIGFHYLLMFAMVFYQMRFTTEPLISKIVYNIVTPFVYIFDFCRMNWLKGPTLYGYVMCYVPMYYENVVMSALVLWHVNTLPSPAWYTVPGCICVIVMFPLGVLVQLAYYRYWHTSVKREETGN